MVRSEGLCQRKIPMTPAGIEPHIFRLLHLVGFIIRIHHDARSPERQIYWQFTSHNSSVLRLLKINQYFFELYPVYYGSLPCHSSVYLG